MEKIKEEFKEDLEKLRTDQKGRMDHLQEEIKSLRKPKKICHGF